MLRYIFPYEDNRRDSQLFARANEAAGLAGEYDAAGFGGGGVVPDCGRAQAGQGIQTAQSFLSGEGSATPNGRRRVATDSRHDLRGARRVIAPDARVAALCRLHGVRELWTADRDFSRFAGPRAVNPLVS